MLVKRTFVGVLLLLASAARAQTSRGTITGTVIDASGARLTRCVLMRLVLMPIVVGAISLTGIWNMNAARSTFAGDIQPKSLTLRIEAHAKGEDSRWTGPRRTERPRAPARSFTSNGTARDVGDAGGGWIRFVRRSSERPNEMVLEITAQQFGGRRFERRLVLDKQ
jgi:hypothetical protein